jgi:hypothetical protein
MNNTEYMREYMREYRRGLRRTRERGRDETEVYKLGRILRRMVAAGEIDPLLAISYIIDPPTRSRGRIAA